MSSKPWPTQKYVPRSNWEKYFSALIEEPESSLEKKWELLYKLRNKVAHNRHVKRKEFEQIKGLTSQIKEILAKASAKVVEIDLNEEDRELIIYSYSSDSPSALGFMAEKAVAEFYTKSGYQVDFWESRSRGPVDFVATKDGVRFAVEVKSIRPRHFVPMMRNSINRQLKYTIQSIEGDAFAKLQIVVVLRDDEDNEYPISHLFAHALRLTDAFDSKVEIQFGRLNEENEYIPIEYHGGA